MKILKTIKNLPYGWRRIQKGLGDQEYRKEDEKNPQSGDWWVFVHTRGENTFVAECAKGYSNIIDKEFYNINQANRVALKFMNDVNIGEYAEN